MCEFVSSPPFACLAATHQRSQDTSPLTNESPYQITLYEEGGAKKSERFKSPHYRFPGVMLCNGRTGSAAAGKRTIVEVDNGVDIDGDESMGAGSSASHAKRPKAAESTDASDTDDDVYF